MEKNCILSQSLIHSPSLFDAPGTEAFSSKHVCMHANNKHTTFDGLIDKAGTMDWSP